MNILKSKKARAAIAGAVVIIVGAVLSLYKIDLSPEQQLTLVKLAGALLTIISAGYSLSQGIADAGSHGRTSSSYRPETDRDNIMSAFGAIRALGLEIKQP